VSGNNSATGPVDLPISGAAGAALAVLPPSMDGMAPTLGNIGD
jgi:hypothetical protein